MSQTYKVNSFSGEKKLVFGVIFLTILILVSGIYFVGKSPSAPKVTASENVQASVDSMSFDWGTVSMKDEKATKSFTIKNTGQDILKLFNVRTSCHCTLATVTINEITSQSFGMSGVSSWTGEVKPGEDAQLTVVFDQAYHGPNGVGPITRYISVETNDRVNKKLTFTLTATVTQ